MNDIEYYTIPRDVKRYVLTRRLKRIVPLLLLFACLVLAVTCVPFVKGLSRLNKEIIIVVGIILSCVITGVPFKLIEPTRFGEVINVRVKARRDEGMGEYPYSGRAVIDARHFTEKKINAVLYLTLKAPNGKVTTVRAGKLSDDEERENDGGYKTGDSVVRVGGADYLVVLNRENSIRCCVCGLESGKENDVCPNCGHTLIKPEEYGIKTKLN